MTQALAPIVKTILFTIFVPGTFTVLIPFLIVGRSFESASRPLAWLGVPIIACGAAIYFLCAWEFAVRGLGTPAPIAPTQTLVVTGLHRYVRNPMYIGVFLVLLGEAAYFQSQRLLVYAACFYVPVELFVLFYEEPTLRRRFGESYEEYKRTVPRWIPRFRG